MCLCNMASELSNDDVHQSVFFRHIDTGIILIGDASHTNQCLVLTEMIACPVRDWIMVKKRHSDFTNFIQDVCE